MFLGKKPLNITQILATFLLAWMVLAPMLTNSFTNTKAAPQGYVSVQTPCPKSQNSQAGIKLCQLFNLQFAINDTMVFNFVQTLCEKIFFIYLLGLLALGAIHTIFKPPKFQFSS